MNSGAMLTCDGGCYREKGKPVLMEIMSANPPSRNDYPSDTCYDSQVFLEFYPD